MKLTIAAMIAFSGFLGFSNDSMAALVWGACAPAEVAVLANRVQIRCQSPLPGGATSGGAEYQFAAISTIDAGMVNHVIDFAKFAVRYDKQLNILYDDSVTRINSSTVPGCDGSNCTELHGIGILN